MGIRLDLALGILNGTVGDDLARTTHWTSERSSDRNTEYSADRPDCVACA